MNPNSAGQDLLVYRKRLPRHAFAAELPGAVASFLAYRGVLHHLFDDGRQRLRFPHVDENPASPTISAIADA